MGLKKSLVAGILIVVILGLGLITYRVVGGRSLGLGQMVQQIRAVSRPVFGQNEVVSLNKNKYTNIIFIHHSVGNNLIHQGNLREQFQQLGYHFWDQDTISAGLTRPDGTSAGYSYNIPDDNTDIDGYAAIFQQPVYKLPVNAFSALLQHEVVIFKSCYPNSQFEEDATFDLRKQEYLAIRQKIDQYPDHLFFLLTSPPLNPAETNPASAARARDMANWLTSPEFLDGHPNLRVFDFFGLLAESDPTALDANMLKAIYRDGKDSHPNLAANEQIAPLLVTFVNDEIARFRNTQ